MDDLVVTLARIQFALTITFHYLFPPMSIGLGLMIVFLEGLYLKTKEIEYKKMAKFWTNIFALFFAMGVASGFVQLFAFGNNWSKFATFVGDVFGSLLAAEGIFAFFLEASFMGFMLFGWDKLKPKMHYLSTCLVVFGAHFSAIWIVMANSWMQTPAGYRVVGEGVFKRAVITSLWDVYFTPSTIDRIVHTLLGCWLMGSFMILSVSAYFALKKRHLFSAKKGLTLGLWFSLVTLILQLISADSTAKGVAKNQPVKFAAMEGIYETTPYAPIGVIGYVDTKNETVVGFKIPGLLSFLAHGEFDKPVTGLNEAAPNKEDRPNVQLVFQAYHLMILSWGAMMMIVFLALIAWKRKKLMESPKILWSLVFSILFPYIANMAGWYTAECGRQPWTVQGLLRTSESVTGASVSASQIYGSLGMFSVMYLLLFSLFIFLLNRKIQYGPEKRDEELLYRRSI